MIKTIVLIPAIGANQGWIRTETRWVVRNNSPFATMFGKALRALVLEEKGWR